ncbi:MAG: hypothetical protein JHC93_01050 [Parachlamydiales bacterium]|nr:hypothetical protein [Parachlamydiales bacterium]
MTINNQHQLIMNSIFIDLDFKSLSNFAQTNRASNKAVSRFKDDRVHSLYNIVKSGGTITTTNSEEYETVNTSVNSTSSLREISEFQFKDKIFAKTIEKLQSENIGLECSFKNTWKEIPINHIAYNRIKSLGCSSPNILSNNVANFSNYTPTNSFDSETSNSFESEQFYDNESQGRLSFYGSEQASHPQIPVLQSVSIKRKLQ